MAVNTYDRAAAIANQKAQLAGGAAGQAAAEANKAARAAITSTVSTPTVPPMPSTSQTTSNGSWINPNISTVTTPKPATTTAQPAPASPPTTSGDGSWIGGTKPPATMPALTTPPEQLAIPDTRSELEKQVTSVVTTADKDKEARDLMQGEYYKLYQQGQDLVARGILKENPYPTTYDEYLKQRGTQNEADMARLKRQSDMQAKLDQSAFDTLKSQGRSAEKGVTAAMAQSREGVIGTAKPLVARGFTEATEKVISDAQTRLDMATESRIAAEEGLKRAQAMGDEGAIKMYAGQVAAAKQEIAQTQIDLARATNEATQASLDIVNKLSSTGMLNQASEEDMAALSSQYGVPLPTLKIAQRAAVTAGASSAQVEQFKNQTTALQTMKDLVTQGIELSPSMISQYAAQTGLSADAVLNFNSTAQTIMADKSLNNQEKYVALQRAGIILDQEQRGIFGQEMQKADFIKRMYAEGRSQEEIAQMKNMLGIKDMDDPKYAAEVELAQAQAAIEGKKARGEPVTIDEQKKYLELQRSVEYYNGNGSKVFVPKNPKAGITLKESGGALSVTPPANTQFQCGAYVNRSWGKGIFGDKGAQKEAIVDKDGVHSDDVTDPMSQVKPGMAFILGATPKNPWGHVGLVTKVFPDGTFETSEANANGKCKYKSLGPGASNVTTRIRNISDVYGFVAPPAGAAQLVGDALTQGGEKGAQNFNVFMSQAQKMGLPYDKAEAWATKKAEEALESEPVESSVSPSWATTIINNAYGDAEGGKAAARKNKELAAAISAGDKSSARSIITNSVLDKATVTERAGLEEALNTDDEYAATMQALDEYISLGKSHGITNLIGNEVNKRLLAKRDPRAVELQQRLSMSFNSYRKAITGAGASTTELDMLAQSFPTWNKNLNDTKVMLNVLRDAAKKKIDRKVNMLSSGAFSSYDDMNNKLDSIVQEQPKPNPFEGVANWLQFNFNKPTNTAWDDIDVTSSEDILNDF